MSKKGFTMTELIVSIAIIAVVMIFLVNLLVDIRYDNKNELYDTKNQINRAEILKTIQNDLDGKNITSITDNGSTQDKLVININTDKGNVQINASSNSISYKSSDNKTTKWTLEKNNDETYIQTTNAKLKVITCNNSATCDVKDKIITINIPIIVDKSDLRKNNDSQMDNIILTFYNYSENSIESNDLNPA